jgi:peroxiredoxin Q/BCP
MRFTSLLALGFCVFPLITADKPTPSDVAPPAIGTMAPDFTLNTPEGEAVTLSKLSAKSPVVLIVLRGWPGYQCPICTKQVGQFVAKSKELEKAGATLLLVYPGPSEELKAHAEEFRTGKNLPANFHFVIDPDYVFTNQYHLRWNEKNETAYPSTFIVDKTGTIRYAHTSHTHGDRTSPEMVLEELGKLK